MKAKVQETIRKHNLANSVIPAIQQHVLNSVKANTPDLEESQLCEVLSYSKVFDAFNTAACKIRNLTNQIDIIMLKQVPKDLKTQRIRMSENF